MKIIADLHIHSKYSRATSPSTDLENLNKWAQIKGINVLATGDFTHPQWFLQLKDKLTSAEPGLFILGNSLTATRFLLSSEISCIYSKNDKTRKIHLVVLSPSLEIVKKINDRLELIGNIKSDGRPILGLDAKELAKIILNISSDCVIIPAHIWTPWFSLFGSRSGFDSIEECFEEYSKYIFAVETGLSSNPQMNWRLSELDKVSLISNSDAHSPAKIGREANVLDTNLNYFSIIEAIKSKDRNKFLYTIEFFPEEGKYHYDGHRLCNISFSPEETRKHKNICPVCKKPLTIGVLSRVEALADRPIDFNPVQSIPFKSLISLEGIIKESLGVKSATKEVINQYQKLISSFKNELEILLSTPRTDLEKVSLPEIVEGIIRVRDGKVLINPGYDGVFGKIKIFSQSERKNTSKQSALL
ncbi:endonuclease Q family protein [Patescibacteria group bacterium]|nr:endonuclease Q family protein [Patescibacteria group bacterium]MBU1877298.1 endonuclease Q family protein [Patescibacteria group bacterium]